MKKLLHILDKIAEWAMDYGGIVFFDIIIAIYLAINDFGWQAYAILAGASVLVGFVWKFILKRIDNAVEKGVDKFLKKLFHTKDEE